MSTLFIIPARGGSKGIPRKNIKLLSGKPLIGYAIELAKMFTNSENICVSTDDIEIAKIANDLGVNPPFIRSKNLASDNAGMNDVILDAIQFYEKRGVFYEKVVVLQPTSPLRTYENVKQAMDLFTEDIELVVSVKETSSNPYYVLFEENSEGFLVKSKPGIYVTRQECPIVYEYNGAVYVYSVAALKGKRISDFSRIKKMLMSDTQSIDIDTPIDWDFAEFLLSKKLV
jgi:CMP-N,N'-diacetyllegionaminic acid synthase